MMRETRPAPAAIVGVDAAKIRATTPSGIELNPTLVAFARERYPGHTFWCGTLEATDTGEPFDGAYCSEVIEHIPDSNAFVAALAGALRPGGALFLTTPGVHEYVRQSDPDTWRDFGAPDHKLYYSRTNMAAMLQKHGFRNIAWRVRASAWARFALGVVGERVVVLPGAA